LNLVVAEHLASPVENEERVCQQPPVRRRADQHMAINSARAGNRLQPRADGFGVELAKIDVVAGDGGFREQDRVAMCPGEIANLAFDERDVLCDRPPELHLHGRDFQVGFHNSRVRMPKASRGLRPAVASTRRRRSRPRGGRATAAGVDAYGWGLPFPNNSTPTEAASPFRPPSSCETRTRPSVPASPCTWRKFR
jgi:hypothetical protein